MTEGAIDERPILDFAIAASFVGDLTVLALRGEVDALTAPEFRAFFDTMIDRGHRSVVLDLSELDFMDASGLDVIASGAQRLQSVGGSLAVRTPSVLVSEILKITGVDKLLVLHDPETSSSHLGPEEAVGQPGTNTSSTYGLTQHLRMVTAIPSDNEVVDGALRLVVALARATVGGADGVSVSLRRHGRLSTVAATDQTITDMDTVQYSTGEGPCVDASVNGHWFHAESLATESRWPAFTPQAQALGIQSILSSPLVAKEKPVGALNIYSHSASAFSPKDQELAAVFATEASTILTDAGLDVTEDQLANRLSEVLRTREIISQAQGVLMAREGIGEHQAYTTLRRFSLQNGRPLRERASDVVTSTQHSEADTASTAGGRV